MQFTRALVVLSFAGSSVFAADSASFDYNSAAQNISSGFLSGFQNFVHNKSQALLDAFALGAPPHLRDGFKKNIMNRFAGFESKVIPDITPAVTSEVRVAMESLKTQGKTSFEIPDLVSLCGKVSKKIAPILEHDLSAWASEQEKPLMDAVRAVPQNPLDQVIKNLQNIIHGTPEQSVALHRRAIPLAPLLAAAGKVILALGGITAVVGTLFLAALGVMFVKGASVAVPEFLDVLKKGYF